MNIRKNKKKKRILSLIAGILVIATCFSLYASRFMLCTSRYTIQADVCQDVRMVQLSDLHNSSFGCQNVRLIQKINNYKPDLILITGDLLISGEDNIDVATDLITRLSAIAPVYCSMGNHELEYEVRTGQDIAKIYEAAGATLLDQSYADITINGQNLRIGGIYGYCLLEEYLFSDQSVESLQFMRDFENTDRYTILLSHLPYAWINYGFMKKYDVDLIFSGHIHGGQIRIPLIGGLYEPEMKWFPGRSAGIYSENNAITILSRGLGSANEKLPRFNNIPEIVVVNLK